MEPKEPRESAIAANLFTGINALLCDVELKRSKHDETRERDFTPEQVAVVQRICQKYDLPVPTTGGLFAGYYYADMSVDGKHLVPGNDTTMLTLEDHELTMYYHIDFTDEYGYEIDKSCSMNIHNQPQRTREELLAQIAIIELTSSFEERALKYIDSIRLEEQSGINIVTDNELAALSEIIHTLQQNAPAD